MGIFNILFSRRREEKRWRDLHSALKSSFSNIKNDMEEIRHKLNHMEKTENNINEIQKRINRLEPRVDILFNPNTSKNLKPFKPTKNAKSIGEIDINITQRQIEMLEIIYRLQKETKREYISLKLLATEMYPTKKYSTNKSLISDYTEVLKDFNYILKIRKGRKAHVKLTKKGKEAAESAIKKVNIN